MSKLLNIKQIVTMLNNELSFTISQGEQSIVKFYKISQKHIDIIKNDIDIDIDTDIIIQKRFREAHDTAAIKMGGKKGQNNREKHILLKLQHDNHFPTILCVDDNSTTIYMTYCGDKIKLGCVPSNWKEQIKEVLVTLEKKQIYNNDSCDQNFLVKDDIIYLVDFGWGSLENEGYPYINIIEKELKNYDNLFELKAATTRRIKQRRCI